MKAFVCAALASLTFADKSDFPKDDLFHADCHVSATFYGMPCGTLLNTMDAVLHSWGDDTRSPAGGVYTVKETGTNIYPDYWLWSTRLTKNK